MQWDVTDAAGDVPPHGRITVLCHEEPPSAAGPSSIALAPAGHLPPQDLRPTAAGFAGCGVARILRHITIDCADPYGLATFWCEATGWPVSDVDEPGDDEVLVEAPSPVPGLLFIRVPEGKPDEPRTGFHCLDLLPTDRNAMKRRAVGGHRSDPRLSQDRRPLRIARLRQTRVPSRSSAVRSIMAPRESSCRSRVTWWLRNP
ncbi:VOC family protein [Micromonospora chersina]|uniref:VOC family protein n=1 Tax=Micromonospora chersina TaxID=47854 RepID=UPI003D8EE114